MGQIESKIDEVEEFIKCVSEPLYFIKTYCWIRFPGGKKKVGDVIYQKQEDLINTVHDNRFTITSKTRQCGASTILGCYALWCALFNENIEICIISRKDSEAKEFKRKNIDFIYDNLPSFLQSKIITGSRLQKSAHTRSFDNGSLIKCEGGPNAGRGGTYSFIIIDEAGFVPQIEETWSAIFPTLNVARGKAVVNSTSSALGTWYANQWHNARGMTGEPEKENDFIPVCIEWHDVPHFASQPGWLEEQRRNLTPIQKFRREVLREFIAEGEPFIPSEYIDSFETLNPIRADFLRPQDVIKDLTKVLSFDSNVDFKNNYIKGLWFWRDPVKSHKYIVACDVATKHGDDRSACVVIDVDAGEVVCEYQGSVDTFTYAAILARIGEYYNRAMIVVEYNSMGNAVFNKLDMDIKYPNLYWRPDGKPGWYTTMGNRPEILNKMSDAFVNGHIKVYSNRLKIELRNLILEKGKIQAAQGTRDDLAMAFSIGCFLITDYAVHSTINNIYYNENKIVTEDDIIDQTPREIKDQLEAITGYTIDKNDYHQYKWMF